MTLGAPQQSSRTNRCNGFRSVRRGTLPSDRNPPVIIPPRSSRSSQRLVIPRPARSSQRLVLPCSSGIPSTVVIPAPITSFPRRRESSSLRPKRIHTSTHATTKSKRTS